MQVPILRLSSRYRGISERRLAVKKLSKVPMRQLVKTKQAADLPLSHAFCSTNPHPLRPTPHLSHSPLPPTPSPWVRPVTITYRGLNVYG